MLFFFFSSRRRHTRYIGDWSSDVCSSDLQPDGAWILGRGWDQNKWGDTRFPTHEALTRATPNNPVVLTRVDGHASLANAAAMKAAGITAATKDPVGGRLERTATGEPTGVFIDNAKSLVERVIPPASRADIREA